MQTVPPQFQTERNLFGFLCLCFPIVLSLVFPTHDVWTFFARAWIVGVFLIFSVRNPLHAPPLLLIGWLFLSMLWSASPLRSLATTFQFSSYILLYLLLRYYTLHESALLWGIRLLVSIAIVLSAYGLYQLLYGYQDYFSHLENTPEALLPATRTIMRDWLNALSGRVFSRFALPSQFAGYLLMMFPIHGTLILRERKMTLKILWGSGLLLNVIMFVYTKSFGAWVTLICLLAFSAIVVLIQRRMTTWRPLIALSVVLFAIGIGMLYMIGLLRGQHLWDLQGNNPLWFRLLNWKVAFGMLRDHVFIGTGLSTFGLLYPHYMPSGANESQYVHNSYLQLGVESGLIGLALTLWLVGMWAYSDFKMLKTPRQEHSDGSVLQNVRNACGLGGIAFLLHNIIDFDLYVFPLGALGMALLAITINSGKTQERALQTSRSPLWLTICISCVLMTACVVDWQQTRARQQSTDARMLVQAERYEEAAITLQDALQIRPRHPEYQALAGSIELYRQHPDMALRYFQTAIQAEPATPWFHAGLAEAYLTTRNLSMAYLESRRAAELFPQKTAYQQRTLEIQHALASF